MTDDEAHEALVIARRTQRAAWIRWTLMALFVAFLFWKVQLNASHNGDLIRAQNRLLHDQKATQREARKEYCQLFARSHVAAVRQLHQTRQYLARADTDQASALTKAIARSLPQLRSDVNATRLPHICALVRVPPNTPKYPPQSP